MNNDFLWQTKVAARLHDPAEKALVLLRDPAGHENGTSRAMTRLLGFHKIDTPLTDSDNDEALTRTLFKKGIPAEMYKKVQQADWWAAAADRPQWPLEELTITTKKGELKTLKVANWAQVHWTKKPILIHPLTGEEFDLGKLADTDFHDIKDRSFNHLSSLIVKLSQQAEKQPQDDDTDWQKTLLTTWRFGPELSEEQDNGTLGALWNLLPADTRIPDHSIWDHLDLTSAFAGAFAADPDGEVALLSLSLGPVQPFIAAARSTSDLWAGSHLLSRLSWEAMRVVCERLGPDAILFPRLRGIPQVDLWLRDEMELPEALFKDCTWAKSRTDANPLFAAALPNRFVALVPASQATELAKAVEQQVRKWLKELGDEVIASLLTAAGYAGEQENITTPYDQMKEQLQGFPEVHWAVVPFSLIRCRDEKKQKDLDTSLLSQAMQPFFNGEGEPGFLNTPAWKLLQKEVQWQDNTTFFAPNPGVLYPAVFDLAERVMAAAKASRSFQQTKQTGWRCTLTGENEWLTTDRKQLNWNQTYRQQQGTLWTEVASAKPAWAKKGEHLSALPAIKRLWPSIFCKEMGTTLDGSKNSAQSMDRFVVSTHTQALAYQLENWLQSKQLLDDTLVQKLKNQPRVALPRKLARQTYQHPQADLIARIPGWLDAAREQDNEGEVDAIQNDLKQLFGSKAETYYSLIMMDGDKMGAILSGDETTGTTISYLQSFHPQVQKGFTERAAKQPQIKQYGNQGRAITPNRHLAVSGALNDFSQTVVRHVVEEEYLGRLIYAGGDDVLAMLPVTDLLPAMQRLRHAYSGTLPEDEQLDWGQVRGKQKLVCKGGFAWLDGKLMRMMGKNATASCGAVIAHHQAPLSAVMRELRTAEQRAKNEGGRDAFSITVVKRSGGALYLTEKWGEPVNLLQDLRSFLMLEGVSRRAVYHTLSWLNEHELPQPSGDGSMLQTLLTYQLERQAESHEAKALAPELAQRLTKLTLSWPAAECIKKLRNFLSVAEFLMRETRTGGKE